jgi:hypothetical protein
MGLNVGASGRRLLSRTFLIIAMMLFTQKGIAMSSVQLAWAPSTNTSGVSGYVICYGTVSRAYTNSIDVGNNTNATISNLVPGINYYFSVRAYDASSNLSSFSVEAAATTPPCSFFKGQQYVSNNLAYLNFPNGTTFGYYSVNKFPWVYHQDLGNVYYTDAKDGRGGFYLKDAATGISWYTNPQVFPQLYDSVLKAWLYYYPDTKRPGHYTSLVRRFKNMSNGKNYTR